ncbi:hypothetical protein OE88DRAFT_1649120 [Heliocybe sulcata]|uniref:Uncharacterized protein n=1 Tax=Heliocybe sulcata TaxID=5364 RepID=A0A5C3MLD0_9AGAM|nr:hypothetical protein OE88DRAFT_1649120 [Heliocybe sulcata]
MGKRPADTLEAQTEPKKQCLFDTDSEVKVLVGSSVRYSVNQEELFRLMDNGIVPLLECFTNEALQELTERPNDIPRIKLASKNMVINMKHFDPLVTTDPTTWSQAQDNWLKFVRLIGTAEWAQHWERHVAWFTDIPDFKKKFLAICAAEKSLWMEYWTSKTAFNPAHYQLCLQETVLDGHLLAMEEESTFDAKLSHAISSAKPSAYVGGKQQAYGGNAVAGPSRTRGGGQVGGGQAFSSGAFGGGQAGEATTLPAAWRDPSLVETCYLPKRAMANCTPEAPTMHSVSTSMSTATGEGSAPMKQGASTTAPSVDLATTLPSSGAAVKLSPPSEADTSASTLCNDCLSSCCVSRFNDDCCS